MKKKKINYKPWLFLSPALFVYIVVVIAPIIYSLGFSFYNYSGIGKMTFAGLGNYKRMFCDSTFITAIKNNLLLMVGSTAIQMILGLGLAILLSNIRKFANALRVAYFIPCIILIGSYLSDFFKNVFNFARRSYSCNYEDAWNDTDCFSVRLKVCLTCNYYS